MHFGLDHVRERVQNPQVVLVVVHDVANLEVSQVFLNVRIQVPIELFIVTSQLYTDLLMICDFTVARLLLVMLL